ncbi:MAG: protein kinase [Deltaproteobacteria bacterium]|nr:protein kinase [Deltaproteobacteria bacterium]
MAATESDDREKAITRGGDPFELLYAAGERPGEAGPGSGHFEALLRLAAGYQFREEGIVEHLRRVSAYVSVLARTLGWPDERRRLLELAALFHDVGMVDVPEPVLRKEGRLSDGETRLVRKHPELGHALLASCDAALMREAALVAWTHHEAHDGSGYPRGLAGDGIPPEARLVAVADVFDALTTRRAFKDPYPFDVACEIVRKGAWKRFDPDVVAAFLECRDDLRPLSETLATPDRPTRTGFRISARDTTEGEVFDAAQDAYFSCPFCGELHPRATDTCPRSREGLREIHKLSGRMLAGKYQVRLARGIGGMSTVYEAHHALISRRLAIKFLDAELARNPQTMERFRNEATVSSTVGHPNLVEVTDMGETPEGIPYIVMELLEGRSLAELIAERTRFPVGAVVTIGVEVLRTLAAVHAKGIVHRDLKPDNLFLPGELSRPRLKILDFGVSLLVTADERRKRLTQAGDVFGTPQYMSPEQAQGKLDVDARSDLFTLGAILYEMLAGRPAFDGPNPLAVINAVALCEVEPLGSLVPGVDPDLERIVLRALERDARDRWQSADEMLEWLVPLARRDPRYRDGRLLDLAAEGTTDAEEGIRPDRTGPDRAMGTTDEHR